MLFGGWDPGRGYLGDTWTWDGAVWTRRSTSGPGPRRNHALAADPRRAVLVLYGGMRRGGLLDETWEWDGDGWDRREPASTPGPRRVPGGMVYDPRLGACVLFGGKDDRKELRGDTWAYDGKDWRRLADPEGAPLPRHWVQLAWDADRQCLLLFGGQVLQGGQEVTLAEQWAR